MPEFDLLIRDGKVVFPAEGVRQADVAVRNGRIAAVLTPGHGCSGSQEINAAGLHVFPGVIDPHTHVGLGDPIEDFATETRAAAIGGVTTVLTFFRQNVSYDEVLPELFKQVAKRVHVDWGMHLGLMTDEHLERAAHYYETYGINSFKFYMAYKGEEGRLIGIQGIDDGFLLEGLQKLAQLSGAVALTHCENIEIIYRAKRHVPHQNPTLQQWFRARPDIAEAENIMRATYLAHLTGCPLYVVHISSSLGLDEVRAARNRGFRLTAETCPHYLTHTDDMPLGALGKVNPPLRQSKDNKALWEGLLDGTIDTIGTDHVPNKAERKVDLWTAPPGLPGVSSMLPVLISEGYHKRGLPLERIAALLSLNPARALHLAPRKGSLQVGGDADMCLVDLELTRIVTPELLGSRADYTIYDGWRMKGWPVATIVRGKVVMREGQIEGTPGWGEYLRRPVV